MIKNFILLIVASVCIVSCTDYNKENQKLRDEYDLLTTKLEKDRETCKVLDERVSLLKKTKRDLEYELNILKKGNHPRYFVKLRGNTYKYTKAIIWVETTEEAYYQLRVGQEIYNNSKPFNTCTDRTVTVLDKRIVK